MDTYMKVNRRALASKIALKQAPSLKSVKNGLKAAISHKAFCER